MVGHLPFGVDAAMDENRFVKVLSPLGNALGFLRMTGEEILGQPFEYKLDLLSQDPNIDFSKLLGKPMAVQLELADLSSRYFHGYVTDLRLIGGMGNYAHYRAVLRPWIWLLSKTWNCRVFNTPVTAPDRVVQILKDWGFTDVERRLATRPAQEGSPARDRYRVWEFRVQYRESDFQFISRLLEQEGAYYYFKHSQDRHVLVLADDHGSHDPVAGYDSIPYYPPTEHNRRDSEYFETWSMIQQVKAGAFVVDDFNFQNPKPAVLRMPRQDPDKYDNGSFRIYDYPGEYEAVPEGQRYTQVRLEQEKAGHEIFVGVGNVRNLAAGDLFTMKGHPRDDQNRSYLVVSCRYEISNNAYESGGQPSNGVGYRCAVTAIDGKRTFRVPRLTARPKVEGPQTAIVVGEKDNEITTDPYGRVKVQFHWDQDGKRNEESSCWVRVAQIWAGTGFGGMFIPRIGQEVIVDFLEGNPDRPIITGRVYNKDNMPPYTLPANKTQSGIKSRSTKGGQPNNFNEMRFEDKKGEEEFHMQAEKNMSSLVKHDRSASIGHDDSISVGGDRSVHVTGNLAVTVDGGGKSPNHSSHSVTGKYNLHASDTIEEDAPNHVKITCGDSFILIEPKQITLVAGGQAFVVLDKHVLAQSSEGSQVVLDDKVFAVAKTGAQLLLDPNVLAQSKGGSTLLLDGDATLATKGDVKLGGANIEATGKQKVAANGGGSQVELTQAGATMSGQKIGVSGATITEITGAIVKIN
jgi:type VI secretion system secreted protein VgrG